jgi:hypothetical protein
MFAAKCPASPGAAVILWPKGGRTARIRRPPAPGSSGIAGADPAQSPFEVKVHLLFLLNIDRKRDADTFDMF